MHIPDYSPPGILLIEQARLAREIEETWRNRWKLHTPRDFLFRQFSDPKNRVSLQFIFRDPYDIFVVVSGMPEWTHYFGDRLFYMFGREQGATEVPLVEVPLREKVSRRAGTVFLGRSEL